MGKELAKEDFKGHQNLDKLHETSWRLSRQIIEITTKAGSGHPSSSLSAIDVLVTLYFGGIMQYEPDQPDWPERDRFILSKGHAAPGLYVTLAEAGYFEADLLPTLREFGSPLEGHPNMLLLPGVEASTGSLGQGLSIGVGHALAGQIDGKGYRVYVMIGDGEADEGQIWEAGMAAVKFGLDHLTVLLDHNQFQQTGPVKEVMPTLLPFADKWRAFGWYVEEVDGHNMEEVLSTLKRVREIKEKAQIIICHTRKGKGLSPFEKDDATRKHGVPLTQEEAEIAYAELNDRYTKSGAK